MSGEEAWGTIDPHKMFSGDEVSALCQSLELFYSNLVFMDLALYTRLPSAGTGLGPLGLLKRN